MNIVKEKSAVPTPPFESCKMTKDEKEFQFQRDKAKMKSKDYRRWKSIPVDTMDRGPFKRKS